MRMPYHAALCRALASGDGEACQRAGTAVEQAACRAQAATIVTACDRWRSPR
jgi:hypothetical protein